MPDRPHGPLRGVRVIVAGAGLAGLVAARSLARRGASVRIFEPRDRVGGRIWTFRGDPIAPFHAELGGEFIERDHKAIRALARDFDLPLVRVLRRGFGLALEQPAGRVRLFARQTALWERLGDLLQPMTDAFDRAGRRWDSTVADAIAKLSLHDALEARRADAQLQGLAVSLRGLLLADPDSLSALVAVEQLLDTDPSRTAMYRIEGGADRLPAAIVNERRFRIELRHEIGAIRQDDRAVAVVVRDAQRRQTTARADYVVVAAPVSVVRHWEFTPALPRAQQDAFATLTYGAATKVVLRYGDRWWRQPGRPRAFATNMPIGAVWEAAEDQKKAACLTLLGGGGAGEALAALFDQEGPDGLTRRLRWLGGRKRGQAHGVVERWEHDEWARGGYAYFSPVFDPALRPLLGRASGRVVFAGSHTSREFQGYMNGAVESGDRAAREVVALERMRPR